MVKNNYDKMFDEFCANFGYISKDAVEWWPSNRFEITIRLDDNSRYIYNSIEMSIRQLQDDGDPEDEVSFRKVVGQNLRNYFDVVGKTRQEIAKDLGISTVSLSNYLTGKTTPSSYILIKLSKYLNCSITDLTHQ